MCLAFYKVKLLRTPANMLLVSLAVTDLCFVPVFTMNIVGYSSGERLPETARLFRRTIFHALNMVGLWHLAVIGIERLLAIKYPLRYKQIVTRKRAVAVIILTWILAVAMTIWPTILKLVRMVENDGQQEFTSDLSGEAVCGRKPARGGRGNAWRQTLRSFFASVFPLSVPYIILFVTYTWISVISWRHYKRIKEQQEAVCPHRKLQMKFVKTSAIVMGSFLILFSPLLFLAVVKMFQRGLFRNSKPSPLMVAHLVASNSAWLNPPIYVWRNRTYRKAFLRLLEPLLCRKLCKKGHSRNNSQL